jgi:hypothetical protein
MEKLVSYNLRISGATGTTAPPSPRTRARGAPGAPGAGVQPPADRAPRPGGQASSPFIFDFFIVHFLCAATCETVANP